MYKMIKWAIKITRENFEDVSNYRVLGEKYDSSIHATWIGKYLHSNNAISPSRRMGVNIITKIKLD